MKTKGCKFCMLYCHYYVFFFEAKCNEIIMTMRQKLFKFYNKTKELAIGIKEAPP